MTVCDDALKEANRQEALKMVPNTDYHPNVPVCVRDSNAATGMITFSARGPNGDVICMEKWGDLDMMWAACPSTLVDWPTPTVPVPPPPKEKIGMLYLSAACVNKYGILVSGPAKWPKNLAGGVISYAPLSIWLTQVRLSGIETATGDMGAGKDIDLLDPEIAQPGQTLVLSAEPVEVMLSETGFSKFGAIFPTPWSRLVAAVDVILGSRRDPHQLAAAWNVVARCMEGLATGRRRRLVSRLHLEKLRSVLPGHEALRLDDV